jgi:exonuclease III
VNPGPLTSKFCFATWNVDSLLANQKDTKKDYIESIDSVHKFDIFGICESYLRGSIPPEKLNIQGFAEPLRADSKATGRARGGVCLYYKEHLPLRRREDLEILNELIVVEISLNRKKILIALTYRSPSQSPDQFNEWMAKLESLNDKMMAEKPDSIIFTGDFNARSPFFWDGEARQTTEALVS